MIEKVVQQQRVPHGPGLRIIRSWLLCSGLVQRKDPPLITRLNRLLVFRLPHDHAVRWFPSTAQRPSMKMPRMKSIRLSPALLASLALISAACVATPKAIKIGTTNVSVDLPEGLAVKPSTECTLAKRLNATACVMFFRSNRRDSVGSMCEFPNNSALESVGVVLAATLPQAELAGVPPETEWVALSANSTFPMARPAQGNGAEGERDCDTSGGPVARASGTCFVSVRFLPDRRAIFAEFLLRDDVKRQTLASAEEIKRILVRTDVKQ